MQLSSTMCASDHVHDADGDPLVIRFTGLAVVAASLPSGEVCASSMIDLSSSLEIPSKTGVNFTPSALAAMPNGFQNLTDIHTRRNAKWVQHDIVGVPSGKYGISSIGRILEITPLLP